MALKRRGAGVAPFVSTRRDKWKQLLSFQVFPKLRQKMHFFFFFGILHDRILQDNIASHYSINRCGLAACMYRLSQGQVTHLPAGSQTDQKKQGSNCFNFLSSWTIPPSYKVSVTTGPSLSRISSFSRLLISAWKNMLRRCDVAISCKTVQISRWSGSVTRWKCTSCAIDLAFVDVLILRLNNRVRMLHCVRQLDVFSRLKTNKQTNNSVKQQ